MRIGILGGGQLAQLMCQAANELGLDTVVLSPDEAAPARGVCSDFILGDYSDPKALAELVSKTSVVTLDNEHIPLPCLEFLQDKTACYPTIDVMRSVRDRLSQRDMLQRLAVPQTQFCSINSAEEVAQAQAKATFPAVLKSRHGGYDGYGQQVVKQADELAAAWEKLQHCPAILEAWVHNAEEFSVVGARAENGDIRLFKPIKNDHVEGQLHISELPYTLNEQQLTEAEEIWRRIADDMAYRGTLSVEFFITPDGSILVNEIAPRVHNSGHVTQMSYAYSQFDLHMRAMAELELPELGTGQNGIMLNLYPQHGIHNAEQAQAAQVAVGGTVYWYGKTVRPRRKMGHWLLPPELQQAAMQYLKISA